MILGNTTFGQYTSYKCPDPYAATVSDKYLLAMRIFENLYERAHANKKKPNVELKIKHQTLTYVVALNPPIIGFLCLRHNYSARDAFEVLREKMALAK